MKIKKNGNLLIKLEMMQINFTDYDDNYYIITDSKDDVIMKISGFYDEMDDAFYDDEMNEFLTYYGLIEN